jgi:hypothetical protein
MPAVDLAYQLRAGADILAGAGHPDHGTAGRSRSPANPWLDQQWGAQVLLAGAFRLGRLDRPRALRAALVAIAFGLTRRCHPVRVVARVAAGGSARRSPARRGRRR